MSMTVMDALPALDDDAVEAVRRLWESRNEVVLAIRGGPELTIGDATSCRMLLELVERLATIVDVREGIFSVERGDGRPLDEVIEELRRRPVRSK